MSIQNSRQIYKGEYSAIQRNKIFVWMANASDDALCEVMKHINPAPYKKLFGPEKARLHALLAAAERVRATLTLTGRKNHERDLDKLDEIHALRLEMIRCPERRRSPKREKLALHEGAIRRLFAEGFSLRQACEYLRRHAGLKVSPAYLRECCLDMGVLPAKENAAGTIKEHHR